MQLEPNPGRAAAAPLTGVFAPGSSPLPESLRTLVVEPSRSVAPGETIRAQFSFSNFGGATATGLRVRFALPSGVTHIPDLDSVDEKPLCDGEHLVDASGALVGDLEPEQQRVVACSFRVNDTIEDASTLVFAAALVGDRTALLGSNREQLVVRSRPLLQHASTTITLSAPEHPRPGDTITVRASIANTGSSSAHEIVLLLPSPQHTTYVARSARVDGRTLQGTEGEPFDYGNAAVVCERLAPGKAVAIEYQVTIAAPLADGTRIAATGSVGSRECPEFVIASPEIVVASPADFSGEESSLTLLCDETVEPGMRIPIVVRAVNAGTGSAELTTIAIALPAGLVYAPGSAQIDGQPVADESIPDSTFAIGTLAAGRVVEVGLCATVAVPLTPGDTRLEVEAALRWRGGERNFSRRVTLRTTPRFNRVRNLVRAERDVAHARDEVRFKVHVFNDGTAPERNVRLRLLPGVHLDDVRVTEVADKEPAPYREPLDLGVVQPYQERTFTVVARVASRIPDRSNVALGAVLEHRGGVVDLGTAAVVVRSRPEVARESLAWEVASSEPLRPQRFTDVVVRFTNSGSDVLRDARLLLEVPPDLRIERAIDARRERDGLFFGEIPAGASHEARMTLRLLNPVQGNRALAIAGWLRGKGMSPLQLPLLDVPVFAQPEFASNAQLLAAPNDVVDAGERIAYEIRLRNEGDGPAERLLIRVVPTARAVYVPATTTINGLPLNDDAGSSPLWAQRGLVLSDIDPGAELRIRWEMSVIAPARAGTALETRAILEWGDGQTLALAAPTLTVHAQPALGETTLGTPFSVARSFPRETLADAMPAPPEPPVTFQALPAAIPRAIAEVIAVQAERLEPIAVPPPLALTKPAPVSPAPSSPALYLDFTPEQLARTIKLLERSSAGGMIQHLFALRMLFPEQALGASPELDMAFSTAGRALRAPLERFFVRLRMPRVTVSAKDLEDDESRAALRALLDVLVVTTPAQPLEPARGITRIEGEIDIAALRALRPELETAPLGAAVPWIVNAHLLGGTVLHDGVQSDALAQYRALILKRLGGIAGQPVDAFHRMIADDTDAALDASLAGVLAALRTGQETAAVLPVG